MLKACSKKIAAKVGKQTDWLIKPARMLGAALQSRARRNTRQLVIAMVDTSPQKPRDSHPAGLPPLQKYRCELCN